MNAIGRAIQWASGNRDHVEKFQVKISEEPDAIDIFSEQLKGTATLDLDSENVAVNYAARRQFLAQTFNDHLPIIQRIYGP